MAKIVFTSVGASLFSNYMKKSDVVRNYPDLARDYESIETQFEHLENLNHSDRINSRFESDIYFIKTRINLLWLAVAKEKSAAELQSLAKIAESEQTDLEVHLLATDTVLSVVACELIKTWLDENALMPGRNIQCHFHFNTHVIEGLQVKNAEKFKTEGFQNLLTFIQKYKNQDEAIINISGGYKAIIPFLTLFAQLERIPLKYLYEESDELITIGNLPFNFDFTLFTDEFVAFETIKPGKDEKNLPSKKEFIENLSEREEYHKLEDALLIYEKENKIFLSEFGRALYKKYLDSEEKDGYGSGQLLGKVMEIKVFEFFSGCLGGKFKAILGKKIGQSGQGDAYDIDVFLEDNNIVWAVEVKPQNVDVLIRDDMKEPARKKTLEYKCMEGGFKAVKAEYPHKNCHIAVLMYHHIEPNKWQVEPFCKLKKGYPDIRWLWLKPPGNYKGNVNWAIAMDNIKEFDFNARQWVDFKL